MADIAELGYKVDSSQLAKAEKALDGNTSAAKKTETATQRLERQYARTIKQAKALGVALGAIGLALAYGVIRNTIEAEKVQAQLAAALKSTAGASGQNIESLNAHASALQRVTAQGDEAIGVAQGVLLTFTKIGGETFPRTTEAVLDMATALQMDLKSAAIQVGKALNDPLLGVSMLGRAGVTFSEDQKAMIKALVETGRVAEAQIIVLEELETQFGGSARAARDTLGGALESLKNAFGDLLEGDSGGDGVRGTKKAIEDLTAVLQSEGVKEGFQTIIQGAATATVKFAELLSGAANLTRFMAEEFAARSSGIGGDDIVRLEAKAQELKDRLAKQRDRFVLIDIGGAEAKLETELASVETKIKSFYERTAQAAEAAQAKATGTSSPGGGGAVTERISAQAQQMVDKLKEEAEAYGLSRSALLEREKAQAMAAATNDLEREALEDSYDALIAVVHAEEQAKGSKTASAKAAREAARAEREATQAREDYIQTTEDLRAELEGPVAQVQLAYERKERELLALADLAKLSDQERAETLGLLTQARERDLAAAQLQAKLEAEQLGPREQLFADLDRHIALMKMGRIERETEIALERVLLDLRRQGIELTPEQIQADRERIASRLEEIDAIDKQIQGQDYFRNQMKGMFVDVASGAMSASDAIDNFFDNLRTRALEAIAERLMDQLFGKAGTTDGGAAGGGWASFIGAFFGGGRALGGGLRSDKFYQVGERDRPELANIGGKQFLIPGDRGRVEPMGGAQQRTSRPVSIGSITMVTQGATSKRSIERQRIDLRREMDRAARTFG